MNQAVRQVKGALCKMAECVMKFIKNKKCILEKRFSLYELVSQDFTEIELNMERR